MVIVAERIQKDDRKKVVEILKEYRELKSLLDLKVLSNPPVENENSNYYKHYAFMKQIAELVNRVDAAVSKLTVEERYIISHHYLIDDTVQDKSLHINMGMSRTAYYRTKKKALLRLSIFLNAPILNENQKGVS